MNSCYNPVDLSLSPPPPLGCLSFSITPSPLFSPSFPFSLLFSQSPCYPPLCLSFPFSLPFSLSISFQPPVSLSLSPAEVQSQGFCLLVIYFPISPLSEVHALGLSLCVWGALRATQKKDPESRREEGTLDTLIRREREGGRVGGTEMKGEREDMRYWLGVHLSSFAGYEL